MPGMTDWPNTVEDAPEHGVTTLGDVLYAGRSGGLLLEQEWVALVRAVAAGDQQAVHALYDRASRAVYTFIAAMTGNRTIAEELTLEVFCAVWRKASTYDASSTTVLGWIMQQARAQAIGWLRTRHQKKAAGPLIGYKLAFSNDMSGFGEQSRMLRTGLANLDTNERQAIEAAVFARLPYAEVAKRLNQPLENIEAWIRAGFLKLDQLIQKAA